MASVAQREQAANDAPARRCAREACDVVSVAGFAPEANGFHFANAFPATPVLTIPIPGRGTVPIGDAANGLCGGMVFAARDFFESRRPLPADTNPPPAGSPLFEYLVRRLIDSFELPEGPLRYFRWMSLPDEDSWIGSGVASLTRAEAVKVQGALDGGRCCCLGLVRARSHDPKDLGQNHQVLAWAYDLGPEGRLALHLYDPNHPDTDTQLSLQLGADLDLALGYSSGEATRGFFVTGYERSDPAPALGLAAGPARSLRELVSRAITRVFG